MVWWGPSLGLAASVQGPGLCTEVPEVVRMQVLTQQVWECPTLRFSPAPRVYKLLTLLHAWRCEKLAGLFPRSRQKLPHGRTPPSVHKVPDSQAGAPEVAQTETHTHWVPRIRNPAERGVVGLEETCS